MAVAVLLAALPGLHAAYAPGIARVSAGEARLYGPFGTEAIQVLGAVAGLQVWPAAGVIEPDQRVDAVARTLSPRPPDVPLAGRYVLAVGEITFGFIVAPEQRLPADELGIYGHQHPWEKCQGAAPTFHAWMEF